MSLTSLTLDVNECQMNNGGCAQTCANTQGSFECSCGTGYNLALNSLDCDGKTTFELLTVVFYWLLCTKDVDECITNNGGCSDTCDNTDGSFVCSCDEGYMLAANNLDCEGKFI